MKYINDLMFLFRIIMSNNVHLSILEDIKICSDSEKMIRSLNIWIEQNKYVLKKIRKKYFQASTE